MAAENAPADRAAASRRAIPPRTRAGGSAAPVGRAIASEPIGLGQKGRRHTRAQRRALRDPTWGAIVTDRNDRIREVAYFLWLEDGCPEGQAERHWSTAEALLASDEFERKQIEGEPPGDSRPPPLAFQTRARRRRSFGGAAPLFGRDRCAGSTAK